MTKVVLIAVVASLAALTVSGCGGVNNALERRMDELDVLQRSWVAEDAQTQMVGMTKEDVLACMGPPISEANERDTDLFREVWRYRSGDNPAVGGSAGAGFTPPGDATASAAAARSSCTVNVVMADERVSQLYYEAPSGSYLSPYEQCSYAVAQCVQ